MLKIGSLQPYLAHLWMLSRFGLAGIANTAIGLSIISVLDLGFGVDPHLANAAGYAVGVISGFLLNRNFVFRHDAAVGRTGAKWVIAVAIAFLVNQAVLKVAGDLYGMAAFARLAAQVTAMGSYTLLLFVLCRLWVFRAQPTAALSASAAGQAGSNT